MDALTYDEISRIQKTLEARFMGGSFPGLQAIGFGPGLKKGVSDPDRPYAVCFFVSEKRTPRDRARRLPSEVTVRLKRGKRYVTRKFPTDVVEQPPFRPTAHHVLGDGGFDALGSVGAVIRWPDNGDFRWGLLTVGHFLRGVGVASLTDGAVVSIHQDPNGQGLPGQLIARSKALQSVDVAVIAVAPADLHGFDILDPVTATPMAVLSVDSLSALVGGVAGATLSPDGTSEFTTVHFLASSGGMIEGLPSLRNVIRVQSDQGVFAKGTSGSAWLIQEEPAALQVAGTPTAFRFGMGQSLETQLEWVQNRLALPELPEFMGTF